MNPKCQLKKVHSQFQVIFGKKYEKKNFFLIKMMDSFNILGENPKSPS